LPFLFGDQPRKLDKMDFALKIPAEIKDKANLLSCYAKLGNFPAYFGHNWDALDELLRDFSWTDKTRIVVKHADLPLFGNDSELRTYLEILLSVTKQSTAEASRKFIAIFPTGSRSEIMRVLQRS
jgi:hypothetical protein